MHEENDIKLEEIFRSIELLSGDFLTLPQEGAGAEERLCSREELEEQGFCEAQIDEIMTGMKQQLSTGYYARSCYNWKQMREIRMGLLENLDVGIYANYLFSAEQMREIRMGLLENMDVHSYANLIFSAMDMAKARKKLLGDAYCKNPEGFAREFSDEETGIRIRISNDCMKAYVTIPKECSCCEEKLERVLNQNDIICGISKAQLRKACREEMREQEIRVAEGKPASPGKDGRYEYFFDPLLPDEPQIKKDGSVDYASVIVADRKDAGDVLAKYYPAEEGKAGETVTGIVIPGSHGKEQGILKGQGIFRSEEKNLYYAAKSGYVVLDEEKSILNVWDVYMVNGDLNRYNGNISYNGIVYVKGSVSDMVQIEASGNVVVDGYVEAAHIKAGDNIILRSGMNGCGNGILEAGGKVSGKFFEAVSIYARGDVEGNYFLNCNVVTDKMVLTRGSKSKIMGGHIKAGCAVEAYSILNTGKGGTFIDVGDMDWIWKRFKEVEARQLHVEEELRQLREGKEKLDGLFGGETAGQNTLFQKICIALRMKTEENEELSREQEYYEKLVQRAAKAYILAYSSVQADVSLTICGKTNRIGKNMNGKVTFQR